MKPRITRIMLLQNDELGSLEIDVNRWIERGWQPFGVLVVSQPVVVVGSLAESRPLYIQQLVFLKREKDERDK